MAAVAGILSPDGGIRLVVGELLDMRHHVGKGERLILLSDYVEEPIPKYDAEGFLKRIQEEFKKAK